MATFSHLPSGKWRAQVRRAGLYRNATFEKKRDAEAWASGIETQAHHIAASGFAPIPKGATLEMLIEKYVETFAKSPGKTKTATLAMLKREIGSTKLASLSALVLRDFIVGKGSFCDAWVDQAVHGHQLSLTDADGPTASDGLQPFGAGERTGAASRPFGQRGDSSPVSALFLLQEERRFLAQYWKKDFRSLRQEPRQRHIDAQRVLEHFNARRRSLAERAHAEAQCISLPGLLLHRNHRSEVTVGADQALFETTDSLDLPEAMADGNCDGIAHGKRQLRSEDLKFGP